MPDSNQLFQRAAQHIPGGVNSPVRAFKSVGGNPIFFESGNGSKITDVEGKTYIDYVGAWGPMIVGHSHPAVIQATQSQLEKGLGFGAPTAIEIEMAEFLCGCIPGLDWVRMVNSGTEATMTAIRLARGATKRNKIIKFVGCYHGHSDCLLVQAGSGALTFGEPSSAGVPSTTVQDTLLAQFNDINSVKKCFEQHGDDIAGIILEPVAGNMGCIPPNEGFLEALRALCDQHQALLIFDEVMTGFRVGAGSASERYGVTADLITLSKIIGGGLPVGAFGGRKDLMNHLSPNGPVYQAGTLSGNPVTLSAGLATLKLTREPKFYINLESLTRQLVQGLQELAKKHNVPVVLNQVGAMFSLFFTDRPAVQSFADVEQSNTERFKRFFHAMLEQGIYLAPSAYESCFLSSAHTAEDIETTLHCADKAYEKV